MKIILKDIHHYLHRYDTIGDYYNKKNSEYILVSKMKNKKYMRAVLLHELVEKWLTESSGITEKEITDFDIQFEKERSSGSHGDSEPGDHLNAPYRKQHKIATKIEKIFIKELGLDWKNYSNNLSKSIINKKTSLWQRTKKII